MLSEALKRYVDLHRSVGFKFRIQHLLLRNFVRFAEARGDEFVQVARVLDWAARAPSPPQRRNRLLTARLFALALRAEDLRHELPAADALGAVAKVVEKGWRNLRVGQRLATGVGAPAKITCLDGPHSARSF